MTGLKPKPTNTMSENPEMQSSSLQFAAKNGQSLNQASSLQRLFNEFEQGLHGMVNSPIHTLRRNAFAEFQKLGFPKTGDNGNILPWAIW